jgi:hypothetical protein
MARPQFSSLFLRLARDEELRRRFVEDPRGFLRSEGYDPDRFNIPEQLDLYGLEQKVDQAFGSTEVDWTAPPEEFEQMTPDEIWSRFGVILERRSPDDPSGPNIAITSVNTSVAPAVVAYGTSIVTSQGASMTFEKTRLLRNIAKLRKSDLTFSIKGPDGIAVEDLPASTIEALLRRLR